ELDPLTLKDSVREVMTGGVDVVIDPVGGEATVAALRTLRDFCRLAVIGFASGPIPNLPANQVLLRNRSVVGVDWGIWAMTHGDEQRNLLDELLRLVEDGVLRPTEPTMYPLDDVAQALSDLLNRKVVGKIALDCS
ncbi:MAG: zinc-binding dehydrogenase, partial [Actinomycetota bacterium]